MKTLLCISWCVTWVFSDLLCSTYLTPTRRIAHLEEIISLKHVTWQTHNAIFMHLSVGYLYFCLITWARRKRSYILYNCHSKCHSIMLLKNSLWLFLTKPVLWSKAHTVHLIAWNQNIRGLHKVSPFVSVTLFLKSVVQLYGNGQRKKYVRGIKGYTKDREIKIKSEECQEMGICRGHF